LAFNSQRAYALSNTTLKNPFIFFYSLCGSQAALLRSDPNRHYEIYNSIHQSKQGFELLKVSDKSGYCVMAAFEKGEACSNKSISGAEQSPLAIKFLYSFLKKNE